MNLVEPNRLAGKQRKGARWVLWFMDDIEEHGNEMRYKFRTAGQMLSDTNIFWITSAISTGCRYSDL